MFHMVLHPAHVGGLGFAMVLGHPIDMVIFKLGNALGEVSEHTGGSEGITGISAPLVVNQSPYGVHVVTSVALGPPFAVPCALCCIAIHQSTSTALAAKARLPAAISWRFMASDTGRLAV
jgi:hypothetical protein